MRKYLPFLILLIIIALTLISVNFIRQQSVFSNKPTEYGLVSFRVLNGWNNAPVADARIVIPEAHMDVYTNAQGETPALKVPLIRNSNFDNIHPQSWGEVSVLVYRDGYADFALFHLQVMKNKFRSVELLLFPKNDDTVFSLIESPPKQWVNDVINKYRNHTFE
ncbi:MAG TPA: hypothetical protein PLZ84_01030 [Clostridia bacterium]|nr:hypothetical protein [Clostridia bacterium]